MRVALAAAWIVVASALALAEEPVDAAMSAYKAGDYAKAIEIASAVKPDDAGRLRAAYIMGESDLALEKWDDAVVAFREVLAKKSESVPALTGLGRAQTGNGHADEAIVTLERAAKLDDKDVAARRSLGEARLVKGDIEAARTDLEAAVKLDPKDVFSSRSLVDACLRGDKFDVAGAEADRLARLVPDQAMGHFLKGLVLDRQSKDAEAIAAYEKAIAVDDGFLDAHKNLAILCIARSNSYQDKERVKKAFDHFQRYFELGGKDAELKKLYETIKAYLEKK